MLHRVVPTLFAPPIVRCAPSEYKGLCFSVLALIRPHSLICLYEIICFLLNCKLTILADSLIHTFCSLFIKLLYAHVRILEIHSKYISTQTYSPE